MPATRIPVKWKYDNRPGKYSISELTVHINFTLVSSSGETMNYVDADELTLVNPSDASIVRKLANKQLSRWIDAAEKTYGKSTLRIVCNDVGKTVIRRDGLHATIVAAERFGNYPVVIRYKRHGKTIDYYVTKRGRYLSNKQTESDIIAIFDTDSVSRTKRGLPAA